MSDARVTERDGKWWPSRERKTKDKARRYSRKIGGNEVTGPSEINKVGVIGSSRCVYEPAFDPRPDPSKRRQSVVFEMTQHTELS